MDGFLDCTKAIAYLKADHAGPGQEIQLSASDSPVLRPVFDGLLAAYLVDVGDSFRYVQGRHLQRQGIHEDHLHRMAVENLSAALDEDLRVQPYGQIFAVLAGGNFEASSLLLDDLWDVSLKQFVSGEILAAAPMRDVVAFGPNTPQAALELKAVIARVFKEGSHSLTDQLLVRRNGKWKQVGES